MEWTAENIRQALQAARPKSARKVVAREGLIPSAVLVPIVSIEGFAQLLLTRRTDTVETHKGHIAFPGGMVDEDDHDRVATALRETREELGISSDVIEVIDYLDDLATPTGFVITPVVGFLSSMPSAVPNPAEVAEVFLVPLSFLSDPGNCQRKSRMTDFGLRETWQYEFGGRVIWGATAAIIRELTAVLYPSFE
jgi:8-oxo-dGTP pyrophosphatase MutT (NUDIX family)